MNTGYRATVYRGFEVARRELCACHMGTLAHVRDGLKNLTPGQRPPVSAEDARAEQRRAALIAQGYRSPAFDRTPLAESAAL